MTSLRYVTRRVYFFTVHFNKVLPPQPRFPKWYFPCCLRTKDPKQNFNLPRDSQHSLILLYEPLMTHNKLRFVILHAFLLLRLSAVQIFSDVWIYILNGGLVTMFQVQASWNVMAHAQKSDFVFRRKRRVHLNRRGTSVQSTTGSRVVRISGSDAGYTMFRGSVKGTGYPLHSPVSPSLPLLCVTVCHHISTGLYM